MIRSEEMPLISERRYQVERKLWLTADRSRLVEDGDPEASFLFATPGKTIDVADAHRFGLISGDDVQTEAGETVADMQRSDRLRVAEERARKAREASGVENKEQVPGEDKGEADNVRKPSMDMTRDGLQDMARELGIDEPENTDTFPNKEVLIDRINLELEQGTPPVA